MWMDEEEELPTYESDKGPGFIGIGVDEAKNKGQSQMFR